MSDIFISYASADRSRVEPLVDALRGLGWSVWWDRTIPAGKTWDQVIEAALTDARCVIVLWSHASVRSDWVRTEAEEGKRRGILIPAMIEDVNIPLAFKRIQAANLINWSGTLPSTDFDEFSQAISEVLSGANVSGSEPTVGPPGVAPAKAAAGTDADQRLTGDRSEADNRPADVAAIRPHRNLVLIGIPVLACIAGFAWYVTPSHRQVQNPSISFAQNQPILRSPADRSQHDDYPRILELTWEPVPAAKSYVVENEMQVDIGGNRTQWIALPPQAATANHHQVTFVGGANWWRWRITAVNGVGEKSQPSDWWLFKFMR